MMDEHCVNHKLALAATIPEAVQVYSSSLKNFFFQNSAVRMANLHAIQEILNVPLIECKLAIDVHWLSHDNAIKAVVRCFLVSLDREA